jgi:hypothetical protein
LEGSFCTAVLYARDVDRAAAFYAQVVGWTAEDVAGTRSHRLLQSGSSFDSTSIDVARARDFYGRLFGWTSVDTSFEPFATYGVFRRGDVQEAGLLPIGRDWEVSPRWNAIFAVSDCDATLERAKALGGSTLFVHTVPKYGRIGSLSDSGGATFVIRGPVI